MIQFSPSAIGEIKRLQTRQQQTAGFLRLAVDTGGCSGLIYKLDFTPTAQSNDQQFQQQDLQVLVDPQSLTYLQGLTLDYSEDLMGGGFRFYNPQAQQICGCGQSFALAKSSAPPSHTESSALKTDTLPNLGAGI
jgi:iron-sulfur cluster assembly protein